MVTYILRFSFQLLLRKMYKMKPWPIFSQQVLFSGEINKKLHWWKKNTSKLTPASTQVSQFASSCSTQILQRRARLSYILDNILLGEKLCNPTRKLFQAQKDPKKCFF